MELGLQNAFLLFMQLIYLLPFLATKPNAYSLRVGQVYTHMLDKSCGVTFVLTVLPLSCLQVTRSFSMDGSEGLGLEEDTIFI